MEIDPRLDYLQNVHVFCKSPGPAWLDGLRCTGRVRAYVTFETGPVAALALAPMPAAPTEDGTVQTRSEPLCNDDSLPPCAVLHEVPIFGRLSFREALPWVAFLLLQVGPDDRSPFQEGLADSRAEDDDLYVAASRVFGAPDTDFVVEVMGTDRDRVLSTVARIVDQGVVRSASVNLSRAHLTRGFGTVPE